MGRVVAFEASPSMRRAVAKSRARARAGAKPVRKPRRKSPELRTYEVACFPTIADLHIPTFRVRCARLTQSRLAAAPHLIGAVSRSDDGKRWSTYSDGYVPLTGENLFMTVRDVTDELAAEAHNAGT